MRKISSLFISGIALITIFSFSPHYSILYPVDSIPAVNNLDHIDSVPVFKISSTGIISSRKEMIPKTGLIGDGSVIRFDAQTNYIKDRGTMQVSYPRDIDPSKPIEFGGDYISNAASKYVPEIYWDLYFPEKKRYSLTFKLQAPPVRSWFQLSIYANNSSQPFNDYFNSQTADITYTAILDFTSAPGHYKIQLLAKDRSFGWYFSYLLIQTIHQ